MAKTKAQLTTDATNKIKSNGGNDPAKTIGADLRALITDIVTAIVQIDDFNALFAGEASGKKQIDVANVLNLLNGLGKIRTELLDTALLGGLNYIGVWNATTNTPTIPTASPSNKSNYYKVSVAGNTNISGITDWQVGDLLFSNGTAWEKIDNTDRVYTFQKGLSENQGLVQLGGFIRNDSNYRGQIQTDANLHGDIIFSMFEVLSQNLLRMYLDVESTVFRVEAYKSAIDAPYMSINRMLEVSDTGIKFLYENSTLSTRISYLVDVNGLVAEADYSSIYTPRSLVDKAYVDSRTPILPTFVDDFIGTEISASARHPFWKLGNTGSVINTTNQPVAVGHWGIGEAFNDEGADTIILSEKFFCWQNFDYAEWIVKFANAGVAPCWFGISAQADTNYASQTENRFAFYCDGLIKCHASNSAGSYPYYDIITQDSNTWYKLKIKKHTEDAIEFYINDVLEEIISLNNLGFLFLPEDAFGITMGNGQPQGFFIDKFSLMMK